MNIQKALLTEHSKQQSEKIASFAIKDKSRFSKLMGCYFSSDSRLAQRAAWSAMKAGIMKPSYLQPYLGKLVDLLFRKDVHPALIRNAIKLFEIIEIPEKHQGRLVQACFGFLESNSAPPAIKAYSMTILNNLSKYYPEIKQELVAIIKGRWEFESPAFKSRGRKVLGTFNKV